MEKGYSDLNFAKLDIDRVHRRGCSEAVFGACKTEEQLEKIFSEFKTRGQNVLATRVNKEKAEYLKEKFPDIRYNETAKTLVLTVKEEPKYGEIAICTGGTGDIPAAEEAAVTAEFYGSNVKKYYDVGVAGIHRLFASMDEIKKANVIIAVAGMEGALGGIIAGLVEGLVTGCAVLAVRRFGLKIFLMFLQLCHCCFQALLRSMQALSLTGLSGRC